MCTKSEGRTNMEPYFGLNYKMERSENFDDLMIYLDKNFVERKIAATLRSVEGIRKNGDGTYTIHYSCIITSFELVFTPGVEFEEVKADGQKVMTTITLEGNTIKHSQRDASGRTLLHVYEFTPETMIIVISLIELVGNTVKHSQTEEKGRTLHHVYEFTPETMTIITTADGLDKVVKRYHKLKK